MKWRIPLWVDWVAAVIALACAITLFLAGCGAPVPRSPDVGASGVHDGPAGILHWLALFASGVAGAGLLVCAVLAVFSPNKLRVAKFAVACLATLVAAQCLFWIGEHLKLAAGLAACALGIGGLVCLWVHRKALEKLTGIDLNRDGRLG